MWFDPYAKLAEIRAAPPATSATTATQPSHKCRLSQESQLSQAPWDVDAIFHELEERAAIREYDGGQSRSEAEAGALDDVAQATGMDRNTLRQIWAFRAPRPDRII